MAERLGEPDRREFGVHLWGRMSHAPNLAVKADDTGRITAVWGPSLEHNGVPVPEDSDFQELLGLVEAEVESVGHCAYTRPDWYHYYRYAGHHLYLIGHNSGYIWKGPIRIEGFLLCEDSVSFAWGRPFWEEHPESTESH